MRVFSRLTFCHQRIRQARRPVCKNTVSSPVNFAAKYSCGRCRSRPPGQLGRVIPLTVCTPTARTHIGAPGIVAGALGIAPGDGESTVQSGPCPGGLKRAESGALRCERRDAMQRADAPGSRGTNGTSARCLRAAESAPASPGHAGGSHPAACAACRRACWCR